MSGLLDAAESLTARWFCVETHAQREALAELQLRRQEIETLLPWCMRERRHARRIEQVRRALFPGYIFARFEPCLLGSVRGTYGVAGVCGPERPGALPWVVPAGAIEDLRARMGAGGMVALPTPPPLKHGDRLTIVTGPMRGWSAIFDRETSDSDRIAILLETLNACAPAVIDRRHVERAAA